MLCRHGAAKDDEDGDLARTDTRHTLESTDMRWQALKRTVDGPPRDIRRPVACVSASGRVLDCKRELNGDVVWSHRRDRLMRQAVQAVAEACRRGSARHLRAPPG